MNWDRIEGNWNQFRERVQERWEKLTKDDLDLIQGSREQLEAVLHERYGKRLGEVRHEIEEWRESLEDDTAQDQARSASRLPETFPKYRPSRKASR